MRTTNRPARRPCSAAATAFRRRTMPVRLPQRSDPEPTAVVRRAAVTSGARRPIHPRQLLPAASMRILLTAGLVLPAGRSCPRPCRPALPARLGAIAVFTGSVARVVRRMATTWRGRRWGRRRLSADPLTPLRLRLGIAVRFRKDRGDDTLDGVEQEIGAVARDEAQRSRTQVQHGAIVGYEIVDEQNDRAAGNRSEQDAVEVFRFAPQIETALINKIVRGPQQKGARSKRAVSPWHQRFQEILLPDVFGGVGLHTEHIDQELGNDDESADGNRNQGEPAGKSQRR